MRLGPYYVASNVKKGKVQLVDLPAGTIFFRSIELKDPIYLFRDFLGRPMSRGEKYTTCMSATQNVFSFHLPKAGFGLFDWTSEKPAWHKYNGYMVYTLAQSRPFINMISPSKDTRPTPKGNKAPDAAIRRCDTFDLPCVTDSSKLEKAKEFYSFDNCVNRSFMEKTGTMGYIAIAADDSLDSRSQSPLASYLRHIPGTIATDLLLQLYVDSNKHRGFPEIAFYSRKTPLENPFRDFANFDEVLQTFNDELMNNEYTILPVALITAEGIHYFLDLDGDSYLNASSDGASEDPEVRRRSIEENLDKFTEKAKKNGIEGYGRMQFDLRTGFFVFGSLAPNNYQKFIADLRSDREEKQVDIYIAANKKPLSNLTDFSKRMQIDGKFFNKAFIFERPSNLTEILKDLNIKAPSDFFKRLLEFDIGRSQSERKSHQTRKNGKKLKGGSGRSRRIIHKKLNYSMDSTVKLSTSEMPAIHSISPVAPSPLGQNIVSALQSMNSGSIKNSILNVLKNIQK